MCRNCHLGAWGHFVGKVFVFRPSQFMDGAESAAWIKHFNPTLVFPQRQTADNICCRLVSLSSSRRMSISLTEELLWSVFCCMEIISTFMLLLQRETIPALKDADASHHLVPCFCSTVSGTQENYGGRMRSGWCHLSETVFKPSVNMQVPWALDDHTMMMRMLVAVLVSEVVMGATARVM